MKNPKTRNSGQWTEARYRGFIRSALRTAWMKWPANQDTRKAARVERGMYQCEGVDRDSHVVPNSVKVDGVRKNNIFVDHIEPIGAHLSWDETVERMLCETENLQVLCKECHDIKTKAERAAAKHRTTITPTESK